VPDYVGALDGPVGPARVGRLRGYYEEVVDPAVLQAHDEAMASLAAMGYEVVDVEVPDAALADVAAWQVCYPETLSLHAGHFAALDDRDEMGAGLLAGTPFVSAQDHLRALRWRLVFQRSLAAALEGCVALALPGHAAIAPRLDDLATPEALAAWLGGAVRLHIPFNYAGVPALCLPAGLVEGMPVSLQLVGLPHSDATLLALGHQFQQATDHHLARPARWDAVAA
jgi:aspartyl-tRNA(Asn)/glutamyl-tRNA(Gln) amidotransferase subunit A